MTDATAYADDPCAYCDAPIPADDAAIVPAIDDDAEWSRIARSHKTDCEWIETRAHRAN